MGMDVEDMQQNEALQITGAAIKFTMLPKILIDDTSNDKRSLINDNGSLSQESLHSPDRPIFTIQSESDLESEPEDGSLDCNHFDVRTFVNNGGTPLTINNNAIKPKEQSPKQESSKSARNQTAISVDLLQTPPLTKPNSPLSSTWHNLFGKLPGFKKEGNTGTDFLAAPAGSILRPHSVDSIPYVLEHDKLNMHSHQNLDQPLVTPLLKLSGKTLSVGNNSSTGRKFSMPVQLNQTTDMEMQKIDRVTSHSSADLNYKIINGSTVDSGVGDKQPSHEFRIKDQLFSFFQASDNKLAMKLFGSKTALMKEKKRQLAAHTWIIHPCSNFRLYWDLLMLIFLFTNLVVLPVAIAFFFDDIGTHWLVFNITCDSVFIIDIVINFRTGLIDPKSHGAVILDKKIIAMKYLKSWFFVDLISSLPFDYVFLTVRGQGYSAGIALRILRLAKVLQLLRLLRISRLVRYVKIWQEFFSLATIVVRIFNLVCMMAMISHWSGCIQFFVPVIQGWPEDSWISIEGLQKRVWFEQYTISLFKALSHMLCIGYGQYPPRNMTDTWLTILSMLMGATCYALFVGHATTLIQSFDTSSRQFRDHLQQVNEYMAYRKLPSNLRRRITDYYEHKFGGKLFNEKAILSELSDSLRKDITSHNCMLLAKNVPFFINADPNFVTEVLTKLEFEMFQPGDIIIHVDTRGDRMYFIQEGIVEIIREDGTVVTRLSDGSYFGEVALLARSKRTATVQAVTYCHLFSLNEFDFYSILESYPIMRRTLEGIAASRLKHLGKDPYQISSRESLLDDVDGIHKIVMMPDINSSHHTEEEVALEKSPSKVANKQFLSAFKSFFTHDSETQHRGYSPPQLAPSRVNNTSFPNTNQNNLTRCRSNLHTFTRQPNISHRRSKSSCDLPLEERAESQELLMPASHFTDPASSPKIRKKFF